MIDQTLNADLTSVHPILQYEPSHHRLIGGEDGVRSAGGEFSVPREVTVPRQDLHAEVALQAGRRQDRVAVWCFGNCALKVSR